MPLRFKLNLLLSMLSKQVRTARTIVSYSPGNKTLPRLTSFLEALALSSYTNSSTNQAKAARSAGHVCGLPTAESALLLMANGYPTRLNSIGTSSSILATNLILGSVFRNRNCTMCKNSFPVGALKAFGETAWS